MRKKKRKISLSTLFSLGSLLSLLLMLQSCYLFCLFKADKEAEAIVGHVIERMVEDGFSEGTHSE